MLTNTKEKSWPVAQRCEVHLKSSLSTSAECLLYLVEFGNGELGEWRVFKGQGHALGTGTHR